MWQLTTNITNDRIDIIGRYGRGNKYCNTLPYGTQTWSTTPKLFFHETDPEQRSRADNRCIRLQMSLCIFFVSAICWKSVDSVQDAIIIVFYRSKSTLTTFCFIPNWHQTPPPDAIRPAFCTTSRGGPDGTTFVQVFWKSNFKNRSLVLWVS